MFRQSVEAYTLLFASTPPACSRSWYASDSLVRICTLEALGVDGGGYVIICIAALHRLVSVAGGGNQAGIKLRVRPTGGCGTVGIVTGNPRPFTGSPGEGHPRLHRNRQRGGAVDRARGRFKNRATRRYTGGQATAA